MRHVPLDKIKFFSNKACVNRPDGARLLVYMAWCKEDEQRSVNRGLYTLELYPRPGCIHHIWNCVGALAAQAVINEFRKGGDFKEESHD